MSRTSLWAMLGVVFCTFFTSFGQLFWKIGADNLQFTFTHILTNWPIFLGFFFYGLGALLLIISLKYGELSVLYPFIGLSFVWVSVMSLVWLGETMSLLNWMGVGAIIGGLSFIGRGIENE